LTTTGGNPQKWRIIRASNPSLATNSAPDIQQAAAITQLAHNPKGDIASARLGIASRACTCQIPLQIGATVPWLKNPPRTESYAI